MSLGELVVSCGSLKHSSKTLVIKCGNIRTEKDTARHKSSAEL